MGMDMVTEQIPEVGYTYHLFKQVEVKVFGNKFNGILQLIMEKEKFPVHMKKLCGIILQSHTVLLDYTNIPTQVFL